MLIEDTLGQLRMRSREISEYCVEASSVPEYGDQSQDGRQCHGLQPVCPAILWSDL